MLQLNIGSCNNGERNKTTRVLSRLSILFGKAKCFPANNMLKGIGANRPCRVNWEVISNVTLNDIALSPKKTKRDEENS